MKKILLSIVAIVWFANLTAQAWQPLPGGSLNGPVTAITSFGGLLWVGGNFTQAGPVSATCIVRYDGSAWISTPPLPSAPKSFCTYNNELYALGGFDVGTFRYGIMKWNGSSWQSMAKLNSSGTIYSGDVFNGELVLGGSFSSVDSMMIGYLVRYDGTNFSGFSGAVTCQWLPEPVIRRVVAINGWLYVGGEFDHIFGDTTFCVAKWNGSTWWSLPTTPQFYVADFVAIQGKVYCAGNFPVLNQSTSQAVLIEGSNGWLAVGAGARMAALDCEEYENNLYVGGESVHYGAGTRLGDCGYWNGSTWVGDTVRIWASHEEVVTVLYNDRTTGSLYAGGNFNFSLGDHFDYIAYKSSVVLPVELTYFTASFANNKATIQWQTASETNADYFSLMVSDDGYHYNTVIATVSAQGTTTQTTDYSTEYSVEKEGIIYFRLEQYDWDGICSGVWYCALRTTLVGSLSYSRTQKQIECRDCKKELSIYSVSGQLITRGAPPLSVDGYRPGLYYVYSSECEPFEFSIVSEK